MASGVSAQPTPELQTMFRITSWNRKGEMDKQSYTGNADIPLFTISKTSRVQVSKALSAPKIPSEGST